MARTVMVVEDESGLREALGLMLENSGYAVEGARNGAEALRLLHDGAQPSCIVADLMMPIMDGRQFLRALHADPRLSKIPVIVLSGITELVSDLRSLGAVAYLEKPLDVPKVPRVVAEHCGPPG